MTKKPFQWDQIRKLRNIPLISNAQEISIRRASTLAGKTAEIELKLDGWIDKDGGMSAAIRTIVDDAAGPYLLENPDGSTRSTRQPARADAITIVITGRRRDTGALEHIVLDTDAVVNTPDEMMYEAGSLQAIVTNDCTISINELTNLVSQLHDEPDRPADEQLSAETQMAAEAALCAPSTPPTRVETQTTTLESNNCVRATSRSVIHCGGTTVVGECHKTGQEATKTAKTTRRRAEQQAADRLKIRIQHRLGSK